MAPDKMDFFNRKNWLQANSFRHVIHLISDEENPHVTETFEEDFQQCLKKFKEKFYKVVQESTAEEKDLSDEEKKQRIESILAEMAVLSQIQIGTISLWDYFEVEIREELGEANFQQLKQLIKNSKQQDKFIETNYFSLSTHDQKTFTVKNTEDKTVTLTLYHPLIDSLADLLRKKQEILIELANLLKKEREKAKTFEDFNILLNNIIDLFDDIREHNIALAMILSMERDFATRILKNFFKLGLPSEILELFMTAFASAGIEGLKSLLAINANIVTNITTETLEDAIAGTLVTSQTEGCTQHLQKALKMLQFCVLDIVREPDCELTPETESRVDTTLKKPIDRLNLSTPCYPTYRQLKKNKKIKISPSKQTSRPKEKPLIESITNSIHLPKNEKELIKMKGKALTTLNDQLIDMLKEIKRVEATEQDKPADQKEATRKKVQEAFDLIAETLEKTLKFQTEESLLWGTKRDYFDKLSSKIIPSIKFNLAELPAVAFASIFIWPVALPELGIMVAASFLVTPFIMALLDKRVLGETKSWQTACGNMLSFLDFLNSHYNSMISQEQKQLLDNFKNTIKKKKIDYLHQEKSLDRFFYYTYSAENRKRETESVTLTPSHPASPKIRAG